MLIIIANREGPDQTASSCDSTSVLKALPGRRFNAQNMF